MAQAPQPTRIELYDTTLRDGMQGEGLSLSVLDKIEVARRLDACGFDYIEGGYPLSNPKDAEFFAEARSGTFRLQHAVLVAFGMTRRKAVHPDADEGMRALLESNCPILTVVGKTWDLHVHAVLEVSLEENLRMIRESVGFLASAGRRVFYDAEHFFDGYHANPDYALATLDTAREAGAEIIVLCDTNGGTLPQTVADATQRIVERLHAARSLPHDATPSQPAPFRVGIHVHNDAGLAVANSLAAVQAGALHVQGTINGIGERCGNVDLTTVAANLALKLQYPVLRPGALANLTDLSRFVDDLANLVPRNNQPFVGISAFAHKGGMHVHAVAKTPASYEHVDPTLVGNDRRILVSELGGQSNIAAVAGRKFGITDRETLRRIQRTVNELEADGYSFEAARASFELLVRECLGQRTRLYELLHYRCEVFKSEIGDAISEATVKLRVLTSGEIQHKVAEGNGPVDALAHALRLCLREAYPSVENVSLIDYKVRVVDGRDATRAKVRVEAEWRDEDNADIYTTLGVSPNIIDASYLAIRDGIEFKLMQNQPVRNLATPTANPASV
mgnify:CR=1 FL=1